MGKRTDAGVVCVKNNMNEEGTHLLFDGSKMIISPDIAPVFKFLMEIEKEIESFLGFNKKLSSLSESHMEMLNFVQFLSSKLKENNIDFQYTFKEHPEKFAEKLNFYIPLRSQVIVLFASLDVLFNLHTAYENETCDEDRLRDLTMDSNNSKKFFNSFLLNEKNQYYKNNKTRLSKIDSSKLKHLRNSLIHFFSIGHEGLSLSPGLLDEKARNLENILKKNKKGHVVFVSPEDLYELIKSANHIRMKKWSDDFNANQVDFKRKMQFVIDTVKNHAPAIILNENLKI